jgi:iron complex outermembrane recepter protein
VSVLNGPGGEGGAINLVSGKPTKPLELEGRSGVIMSGDLADLNQWSSYAYAGTRQKGYNAQVSGTMADQDHFNVSDSFTPSTRSNALGFQSNLPYEDDGLREHSNFEDWRVNAKAGITPNSTDEYSLNYTSQHGEKGAPLGVDRQIVQGYFRHCVANAGGLNSLSSKRFG